MPCPTVLGHEASGLVVEVGSEVEQFKLGDRIVNDPCINCGQRSALSTTYRTLKELLLDPNDLHRDRRTLKTVRSRS